MGQMIKKHIQRLIEDELSWLKILAMEPPDTMYHAILNLAIAWQTLEIEFWLAVAGMDKDELERLE